ncbi:hypothetical protein [Eggerthella sinensis]|nr:hypothetical protein [Eggerthella sinensis]
MASVNAQSSSAASKAMHRGWKASPFLTLPAPPFSVDLGRITEAAHPN